MISLSLLPTSHRNSFQPIPVRASTDCYIRFTLLMGRSLAFGSTPPDLNRAIHTRFPFGSGPKALNLARQRNSPDHYAKGTPSAIAPKSHRPPTARKYMVSGTISLPLSGFFSPFARATITLSVVQRYLALRGGPREFTPGFPCLALLGIAAGGLQLSTTGLSPSAVGLPMPFF